MEDLRTDDALMLSWRDGDLPAFRLLYAKWKGPLYRYLAHQAPGVAEELYQDVWARVIDSRARYVPSAKFSTWLFRIAHNRLMDHFRAQSRWHAAEDGEDLLAALPAAEGTEPLAVLNRKQAAQALLRAVDSLPAAQREAFLLAEEAELTIEEIAATTGVARETAKSRLRYAIAKLRRTLEAWR